MPDSITSIGDYAFYGCTGLTSIILPDSITNIEECAFFVCTGLTSISIGNSVTSIGEGAFCGCTALTSISFTGTTTQWEAVSCAPDYMETVPATVIHCSDGDVSI